jgi:hypothetical protein
VPGPGPSAPAFPAASSPPADAAPPHTQTRPISSPSGPPCGTVETPGMQTPSARGRPPHARTLKLTTRAYDPSPPRPVRTFRSSSLSELSSWECTAADSAARRLRSSVYRSSTSLTRRLLDRVLVATAWRRLSSGDVRNTTVALTWSWLMGVPRQAVHGLACGHAGKVC